MDEHLAQRIAEGYERWTAKGDQSVTELFAPDFFDNVSGQHGLRIFDVVGRWLARISAQGVGGKGLGVFVAEFAVAPPGDGGFGGDVGLAQDG